LQRIRAGAWRASSLASRAVNFGVVCVLLGRTGMKARSMWPKEHGAWAQLAIPLVTALVAGRPTISALLFVVAACAAFFAHEPGAILLGARGTRARREEGRRARRWLASTTAIAALAGSCGYALAPVEARIFAFAALGVAAFAGLLLYERKERTRGGEIIAATALAGAAAPVGAASGLSPWIVLACWAVWSAQCVVSTFAVHALVRAHAPLKTLRATGYALAVMMTMSGASLAIGAR
jgi:hypothetical protein